VVKRFLDHTTPSARTDEASRLFLIVQPPLLLLRRGAHQSFGTLKSSKHNNVDRFHDRARAFLRPHCGDAGLELSVVDTDKD